MEAHRVPRLVAVKNGWLAVGDGWAAHGLSEAEAIKEFEQAEVRHKEIDARQLPRLGENG